MKYLGTIFALLAIVYFSSIDKAHTLSTGAPAANTASPGDGGATCNSAYCHSGPAAQSGENIAVSVMRPLDQGPYRISIEVSNSGGMQYEKVGFQACVEDDFGNKIGEISLVDPTRTKFPNGNSDYITHTFTGTTPSDNFSHLWEFDWTPPANFDGEEATVYVASILSNNNNQNTGDVHISSNHSFNVGVSLEENLELFHFSVYPNPAEDVIHISFEEDPKEDLAIALYDLKGAEVVLFDGKFKQKEHSMIIPLGLAKGVYTLSVHSDHRKSSQKLLIR